jgi:Spy/CpxP family protein refolding chaperone
VKRSSALLSVAALFLSGVSIGALGMHLYYGQQPSWHRPPGFGPPSVGAGLADPIAERLGLSDEQKQRIAEIREESWRESENLRREMKPRVERHMRETLDKIYAELTPEQREELERIRAEFGRGMDRFLLGGPRHDHRKRRGAPPFGATPTDPPGPP